ncbi:MAG: hypothetical protein IJX91_02885 [Clostridia bacterium]|nr:hypothetical protein [Clostridia bacterium]
MVGIVLLTGGSGAIAYFCHAKYKLFLSADGKGYVSSIVVTAYQIMLSLGKAIFLLIGFDVLTVQSLYLILNAGQALIFTIYVRKKYKWVDLKTEPDFEAISQRKSVIVHQISTLIFNNTDVLLLTFFCDLKAVSIYALYKNLINMIGTLVNHFSESLNFKLGQTFDDRKKFLRLHDVYETFHVALTFSLCTIAYVFFLPFLTLYTKGMDANYLLTYMPLLMCSAEILNYARIPSQNVITYAGHFKQTQWRSLLESIINLTVSIAFVFIWGIYGVVLGTVIALLYRTNDIIIYTNHKILRRSVWGVYRLWIVNILFSALTVLLLNVIPFRFDNYFSLILSAVIVCVVVVPIQITTNFLINKESGRELICFIKKKVKKSN